jgi:hypothetical protein
MVETDEAMAGTLDLLHAKVEPAWLWRRANGSSVTSFREGLSPTPRRPGPAL